MYEKHFITLLLKELSYFYQAGGLLHLGKCSSAKPQAAVEAVKIPALDKVRHKNWPVLLEQEYLLCINKLSFPPAYHHVPYTPTNGPPATAGCPVNLHIRLTIIGCKVSSSCKRDAPSEHQAAETC